MDVIHEGANDPHSTGDHFHIQGARNPTVLATQAPAPAEGGLPDAQAAPPTQAPDTPALPVADPTRGPSLYDIAGVADAASSDRYRIQQQATAAAHERLQQHQTAIKTEGQSAYDALYNAHGYALLNGTVDTPALVAEMQKAGVSPQGAAEALRLVREDVGGNVALRNATVQAYGSDPAHAKSLFDLSVTAGTKGIQPGMTDQLGQMVLNGQIDYSSAAQIIDRATSTTQRLVQQGRSDITFGQSQEDRATVKATKQGYQTTSQGVDGLVGLVYTTGAGNGVPQTPKAKAAYKATISSAASAYLAQHPDEPPVTRFPNAMLAARNATATILHQMAALHRQKRGLPAPAASSGSSNPLRK